MERIRKDLIKVINNYMVINEEGIEMDLERDGRSVALVASIPVIEVKRKHPRKRDK